MTNSFADWFIALLMAIFSSNSLLPNAFSCTKGEDEELVFSYSDNAATIYDYKIIENAETSFPLTADMSGGSNAVRISDEIVHAQLIQDHVLTKIKHPSGEITDDHTDIKDPETFRNRIRYYFRFAHRYEYIFDKKTNQLTFKDIRLYPPRKVQVQEFISDPATNHVYPQELEPLTEEEVRSIVPPSASDYETILNCTAIE